MSSVEEQEFELKVMPPAEAIIGKYKLSVQTFSKTSGQTRKEEKLFCLIFNPWNSSDPVYMKGNYTVCLHPHPTTCVCDIHIYDHITPRNYLMLRLCSYRQILS